MIHGDGKQTRDYVYVDDVVAAMTSAATASSVNQMVINVGGGAETSVRDLANLVMQVTGGQPEVITNPRNDGGPARLWADLTLARQKLDYEPDISLETGLRLTLERDPRFQRK